MTIDAYPGMHLSVPETSLKALPVFTFYDMHTDLTDHNTVHGIIDAMDTH